MMSLPIHVRYTKSTGVINLSAHNYRGVPKCYHSQLIEGALGRVLREL